MTQTAERPELLTADELEAYRGFDVSTLFFARAEIEGFISEDYTGPEIRCFFPEHGPTVGYAVTSEWTTLDPESPDLPFLDYYDWITAQPAPRVVVSMDADEQAGRTASFGTMQARTLQKLGVAGVVTGIGIQKLNAMRAVGMPIWSTGAAPAHGSYHLVRYGAPVSVGRVTWRTGDLVFADINGAIRIPAGLAREVLHRAQSGVGGEKSYYEMLDAPDFSIAKMREWLARHDFDLPAGRRGDGRALVGEERPPPRAAQRRHLEVGRVRPRPLAARGRRARGRRARGRRARGRRARGRRARGRRARGRRARGRRARGTPALCPLRAPGAVSPPSVDSLSAGATFRRAVSWGEPTRI